MATGSVKWFNVNKRFGFITSDSGGGDVFVHMSALEKSGLPSLDEGDRVSYDLAESKGRMSAVNIRVTP